MSWWTPTWFPSLPSIDFSLPSSIQKRFISFALRQALGHLLKPGQLDVQQVDSQIGSGFVQIRDVELDNKAINALIAGLPLQLHDGSVGKVTARIPWPNPLTSTVGLSLESLHLTFIVSASPRQAQNRAATSNVADSVASVAESFIHDELDAQEEATLLDSIHSELSSSSESIDHVPGGLDPFLSEDESHTEGEPSGVSIFATLVEKLLSRFEFDSTDLKITLVHPEHASFTLNVPTIRYHTEVQNVHPSSSSQVNTGDMSPGVTRAIHVSGVTISTRCLRPLSPQPIGSGASLSASTTSFATRTATPGSMARSPTPPSPISDTSDLDDETTMLMSQSLAGLPTRPVSPSSSASSSLYQSAFSIDPTEHNTMTPLPPSVGFAPKCEPNITQPAAAPEVDTRPKLDLVTEEIEDELLCSLGSDPIILQMWTPSHARQHSTNADSPSPNHSGKSSARPSRKSKNVEPKDSGLVKLDATIGVVALALRARHIRSLIDLADLWRLHVPAQAPSKEAPPSTPSKSFLQRVDAGLRLRGLVVALLPENVASLPRKEGLSGFFSSPLIPPHLSHGYVRIHLDDLSVSASVQPTPPLVTSLPTTNPGNTVTVHVSLTELSAFAFVLSDHAELLAAPLLITDPNLPYQYDTTHTHPNLRETNPATQLPEFDVLDWTNPVYQTTSAKLTAWRTRPQHGRGPSVSTSPRTNLRSPAGMSPLSPTDPHATPKGTAAHASTFQLALTINVIVTSVPADRRGGAKGKHPESGVDVDINVAPLHAFIDILQVLGPAGSSERSEVLSFLDEVTASSDGIFEQADLLDTSSDEDEVDEEPDTPPGTPRARQMHFRRQEERAREQERLRLERLVLEDLDLGFDYGQSARGTSNGGQPAHSSRNKHAQRKQSHLSIACHIPAIRVEVRAASHALRQPRSGAVVLDIHGLHLSNGSIPSERPPELRFADPDDYSQPPHTTSDASATASARWQRLLVAYCPPGESKAVPLLSVGSCSQPPADDTDSARDQSPQKSRKPNPDPRVVVSQSAPRPASSDIHSSHLVSLVLTVDIPSVFVKLSKDVLDGLQLWADDISRITETAFASRSPSANSSQDPSLIGSRLFAKTRRSDRSAVDSMSTVSAQRIDSSKEIIIKACVGEVALVIDLPRLGSGTSTVRPFNVVASDVDVLLEIKPEGKEETVLTLGVMGVNILERSSHGSLLTFFGPTTPQDIVNHTQAMLKLRFTSFVIANTTVKESRVKLTLCGATFSLHPDIQWINDFVAFAKAPPGVFESVVPSERTVVSVKVVDSSVRAMCPTYPGAMVLHIGEADFNTSIVGKSPESSFNLAVQTLSLFLLDDLKSLKDSAGTRVSSMSRLSRAAGSIWKAAGYALLAELGALDFAFTKRIDKAHPDIRINVGRCDLRLHLCADTGTAIGAFVSDFSSLFATQSDPNVAVPKPRREPTEIASPVMSGKDLLASLDEQAFRRRVPEVGPAPDMIEDDLPSNLDYLDQSFNASAGLMALDDEDEDDFYPQDPNQLADQTGVVATYGGETIRLLDPEGLHPVQHYFDTLPPDSAEESSQYGDTSFKVRVHNGDITVFLYDGYDWERTRRIIEEETKEMKRKLARIRQLLATGQTPDPSVEETNTLLFNSVYIGLEHNVDELERGALIEAIDAELSEDAETASQSSWQSFKPQQMSPGNPEGRTRHSRKVLTRSKSPCIEFRLQGLAAEVDNHDSHESLASRTLVTVRDIEILDHIKTSTWSKFLTSLRTDSRGNIRETGSNMVRVELRMVRPVVGNPAEEARLRAKILPLRLHVDQDALDFLKKFFSFKDPQSAPASSTEPSEEIFFQQVEVFPVDLKLDYKPRRVDYRALRDGRTIELMNFFHFDGAEMTLRHITLTGITGWARMGDLLNDLWTPDVKATQLVEVISGVAPIRSVVNVGSGVADLVLLPISQYKKDGRVVRGLQKGTTAFVRSTATEAVKLGARLATGTQVILEQAEGVIGGQFKDPVTAEALQIPVAYLESEEQGDDVVPEELISRYADQPASVREGVVSAYKSLRRNLTSAAQTILAVPMEVYERSGNEGAVRAVVRAVPIAVLKPMIGASEAISQTLLGLHNTLDPNIRAENEAKYKQR